MLLSAGPRDVGADQRSIAVSRVVDVDRGAPGAELGAQPVRSIFFGGGTPSLWRVAELRRVLEGIVEAFCPGRPPPEITVECNPESVTREKLAAYRGAGVNRVSLGVQSLDDSILPVLGGRVAVAIRACFPSLSVVCRVADRSKSMAAAIR